MLKESMCDVCMSPGHCCRELTLSGKFSEPMSREQVEHLLISPELSHEKTWVFRPLLQDERGIWRFSCTQLLSNGRCRIYEDRPHLCRHYQPGTDRLCVHYVEKDDAQQEIPAEKEGILAEKGSAGGECPPTSLPKDTKTGG